LVYSLRAQVRPLKGEQNPKEAVNLHGFLHIWSPHGQDNYYRNG
jgi:hypothetical protein